MQARSSVPTTPAVVGAVAFVLFASSGCSKPRTDQTPVPRSSATTHAAEVYLRAPVEVNAAIADVANRSCEAGVPDYTGRPVDGSPYSVTYLIDSNQDRTSNNPLPSTVICLLQSSSGEPLVASAHRH